MSSFANVRSAPRLHDNLRPGRDVIDALVSPKANETQACMIGQGCTDELSQLLSEVVFMQIERRAKDAAIGSFDGRACNIKGIYKIKARLLLGARLLPRT